MKVLLINTYEAQGGAAIACKRLLKALNKSTEVEAKLLVNLRQNDTRNEQVYEVADTRYKKLIRKYRFYLEKILFIPFEVSEQERFAFSTAYFGTDISKNPLVKEADILHIHWTNQSFLSYKNIKQLVDLGKPVFVTMHDMWYFTGGCHHSRGCMNFTKDCGNCQFLKNAGPTDLSYKSLKKKRHAYDSNMTFIACSNWLADLAKQSSLLQRNLVTTIPNPIDTGIFLKKEKSIARKTFNLPENKTLILYAAARVDDERKGYKYLVNAMKAIRDSDLEIKNHVEIIVMGNVKNKEDIDFHFPTHFLGSLSKVDEIVDCYNAADLFVTPSLEENLPNTIIESMACGTPAVAFSIGGIPDIIDHKTNGYLANYRDTQDLVNGIEWVIAQKDIAEKCIEKVENTFSEQIVSRRFIELYQSIL